MSRIKVLRETYKTYEGARKRAAFENGIAPSEFKSGYKARLYHYSVIHDGIAWRVQRLSAPRDVPTYRDHDGARAMADVRDYRAPPDVAGD